MNEHVLNSSGHCFHIRVVIWFSFVFLMERFYDLSRLAFLPIIISVGLQASCSESILSVNSTCITHNLCNPPITRDIIVRKGFIAHQTAEENTEQKIKTCYCYNECKVIGVYDGDISSHEEP